MVSAAIDDNMLVVGFRPADVDGTDDWPKSRPIPAPEAPLRPNATWSRGLALVPEAGPLLIDPLGKGTTKKHCIEVMATRDM